LFVFNESISILERLAYSTYYQKNGAGGIYNPLENEWTPFLSRSPIEKRTNCAVNYLITGGMTFSN